MGENISLYRQESDIPRKTYSPENIIGKLRQIEVLISQGHSVAGGCREAGISEQSDYRWRKAYGGYGCDPGQVTEGA